MILLVINSDSIFLFCWLSIFINLGNFLVIHTDSIPCFGVIADSHKSDDGAGPYCFGARE